MLHFRPVYDQLQTLLPDIPEHLPPQRHNLLRTKGILMVKFIITAIIRSIVNQ